MTSIVIVSHSRKIADGLKELLDQIAKGVNIVAIGGAGDGEILGSNPNAIRDTFLSLSNENAIFVVCDFGSTVLSVKYAINMLPEDLKKKIFLVDAPLVEGAYVIAVEASSGSSVEEILDAVKEIRNFQKIPR
jgi:dihydroxyacetone kinase phosphotransfer subunit